MLEAGHNCLVVNMTRTLCGSFCSDGSYNPAEEGCDDGNLDDGDGCDSVCEVETHWVCDSVIDQASDCSPECGDAVTWLNLE